MKEAKLLFWLFLAILIFQSPGIGIAEHNFVVRHSFTDGFMVFWKPMFMNQIYWNFLYPVYALVYLYILFKCIKNIQLFSWQSYFIVIVCIIYTIIGQYGSMCRFRDLLIPIILLVAFDEDSNYRF